MAKSRKNAESSLDHRELCEIWWHYLTKTEAFNLLRAYALMPEKYKKNFRETHLKGADEFIAGYEGRGWLLYSQRSYDGAFSLIDDFETVWQNLDSQKKYLVEVDGLAGEYAFSDLFTGFASHLAGRVFEVQQRLGRQLTHDEMDRVSGGFRQKFLSKFNNRLHLSIDPFIGTVAEMKERFGTLIDQKRCEANGSAPDVYADNMPTGAHGARYRFPVGEVHAGVLRRQLNLLELSEMCCRFNIRNCADDDTFSVSYQPIIDGSFSLPADTCLTFGNRAQTNDPKECEIWQRWEDFHQNRKTRASRLKGDDADLKRWIQQQIAAAKKTILHVENGWFPRPPSNIQKIN